MQRLSSDRGSLWRIWDLHVHTPASYGGDYQTFINSAASSIASVIGINDYCTLKGYEEVMKLGGVPKKIVLPVVEFRMNTLLMTRHNPNGVKVNFHVIFDNDPSLFNKISTWLSSLKCFDENGQPTMLGNLTDPKQASVNFDKVIDSLEEYHLYDQHALIWIPYDEYGGIDEIDPNTDGAFKLSLIRRAHIMGSSTKSQIDFFKWKNEKFRKEDYTKWFERPLPCIKGSDAHKINYPFGVLKDRDSKPTTKHCWVNADASFEGLKQITVEVDRVYIGDEPDLIKRVKNNSTKFIKSLSIKKVSEDDIEDVWFDNFVVELNCGLVAIIGNKGSGKSAITDIIGLCGNTHQDPNNFSFLTSKKFRKVKPLNLSEKFEATLEWYDGTPYKKLLSSNPDKNHPERVRYIPQNYLEKLCTDVDSDEFESAIKQIIYSHTPSSERHDKSSLDELINYKSNFVNDELSFLKAEIAKSNIEIVELEVKSKEDYKRAIENTIKLKVDELAAHRRNHPKKPPVSVDDEVDTELDKKISDLRLSIEASQFKIADIIQKRRACIQDIEHLEQVTRFYSGIEEIVLKKLSDNSELIQSVVKHGIDLTSLIKFEVNITPLQNVIQKLNAELIGINEALDKTREGSQAYRLGVLEEEFNKVKEELDKPTREKQKYLDEIREWEIKEKTIVGDAHTEGSLRHLEAHQLYLINELDGVINIKHAQRVELTRQLFQKKKILVDIRKDLFKPVTNFISEFKELREKYDVRLDVALETKQFHEKFFRCVNQSRIGSFMNVEDGYKRLSDIVDKFDFNSEQQLVDFSNEILHNLNNDFRTEEHKAIDIQTQLKKGVTLVELYDLIFQFDYLQPIYNLKLGEKSLQELSPGERGALLLIFYLILDNNDIPLIIDQPEENLDNESVYQILVHFIKKVKEQRQIIIVTHNPNLAVVCDADQIIHMNIEKNNSNSVKCISGAIERHDINQTIVNILEGTLPAFNNRDSKYDRRISILLPQKKQATEALQSIDLLANAGTESSNG